MNKFDSLFNDMEDNISALDSKISSLQSDLQFIEKKLESTSIQIKLIHTTINNSTIDLPKLSYLKNEINNMDYHWLDVDPQTNLINRELFISQVGLNSSECYNLDTDFDISDESEKLNYIIYILDKLKEEIEFISSVRSNTLNKLSLIRKKLNHFEKLLVDYNKKIILSIKSYLNILVDL